MNGTTQPMDPCRRPGRPAASVRIAAVCLLLAGIAMAAEPTPVPKAEAAKPAEAQKPEPAPPKPPRQPPVDPVQQRYERLQLELQRDGQGMSERAVQGEPTPMPRFGAVFFSSSFDPQLVASIARNVPMSYVLGPGDELRIVRISEPRLDKSFTIGADGAITLEDSGKVFLMGLTLTDATQKIMELIARGYEDPQVEVALAGLKRVPVRVVGNVVKPGSYPVTGLTDVLSVLHAAGGPVENGSMRRVRILRDAKVAQEIDLYAILDEGVLAQDFFFQAGDVVSVAPRGPTVTARGAFQRPYAYELLPNQGSLKSLLALAQGLRSDAVSTRLVLRRFAPDGVQVSDISLKDPDKANEFLLVDGDEVEAISVRSIQRNWVSICGNVWKAGDQPFKSGMTVKQLIEGAGGLMPSSLMERAALWHFVADERRSITPINLTKAMQEDPAHNVELREWDILEVRVEQGPPVVWAPLQGDSASAGQNKAVHVTITGRVNTPGSYYVPAGTTFKQLVALAGDLRDDHYLRGAVYTKKHLRDQQIRVTNALQAARNPMLEEIETLLRGPQASLAEAIRLRQALDVRRRELALAAALTPAGRFGINLDQNQDVQLEDGDEIVIPRKPPYVTVVGAVGLPSPVPFQEKRGWMYYVNQTGGFRADADKTHAFVIQPEGLAEPAAEGTEDPTPAAGAYIVVPEKFDENLWIVIRALGVEPVTAGESGKRPGQRKGP